MNILVINGGSSSLKATLRSLPEGDLPTSGPPPLWDAQADWGRHPGKAQMRVRLGDSPSTEKEIDIDTPAAVLRPVIDTIPERVDAIGHRVVHGGIAFQETTRIDARVREEIRKYCEFAPEH